MKAFRRFPAGWLLVIGLTVGLHLLNAQHTGMMVRYSAAASPGDTRTNYAGVVHSVTAAPGRIANGLQAKDKNDEGRPVAAVNFSTDSLWLQITGITNGMASLALNHATGQVYAVLSKTDLTLPDWTIEPGAVWPTNSTVMPFTVSVLDRTEALFIRVADWTGVTENGNITPDWWFWKYFGTLALLDTNLDSEGNTLVYDYTNGLDPNIISFSISTANYAVNDSRVPVQLNISSGVPALISIVDSTNFIPSTATWDTYRGSNIVVNFSPVEGPHQIWVGLRGLPADAQQTWRMAELTLDTTPPVLLVTNPGRNIVSQPLIQMQGTANESLSALTFDVSNAVGVVTGQPGYITGQFYDTQAKVFTTNYFQCYDLALAGGLNSITLHATDLAGNTVMAALGVTLDFSSDATPPALTILWPPDGASISGVQFVLRAKVDDNNAVVAAQIVDANGNTNTVEGSVQRDGTVWARDLPLGSGQNIVTVTATDAAGNTSTTGFTVNQSAVIVTMEPLPSSQWNQSFVSVSGTISDAGCGLTVNGVPATVNGDGTWSADTVPVKSTGGAVFDVVVQANSSQQMMSLADADAPSESSQEFSQSQPASVAQVAYGWNSGFWVNVHGTDFDLWEGGRFIEHVAQDCWRSETDEDTGCWNGRDFFSYTTWDYWTGVCTDPVVRHGSLGGYTEDPYWGQSASGYSVRYCDGGDYGWQPLSQTTRNQPSMSSLTR